MRRRIIFPPVDTASDDGLVAVGGDLEMDTLITAYQNGIFPWPVSTYPENEDFPNTWFSPDPRGVLFFEKLHVSRSFIKFLKNTPFQVSFNQAFTDVIHNCAKIPRRGQPGTWITPEIMHAYKVLFDNELAYSVEVWKDQKLVGGIYGVAMGNFISGESMFTLEDNASKQGLYALLMQLQSKGVSWIDTQMVTEVVKQFGGTYIPRPAFLELLKKVDWTKKRNEILSVVKF